MNLSTSNSEYALEKLSPSGSCRLYGQVVLKLGLSMLTALLIIFGYLTSIGATGQGILERVTEARQALPQIIADPNDVMMFYGSSMTRAGFSPRQFEAQLGKKGINISAFNYGFGGLNPFFQDLLSRRIVEEFKASDRQLKLVVIEFNPFQATQARWNGALPSVDSYLTLLANNAEMHEFAEGDIERLARLYTIKYLRAGVSAEMITSYFAYEMFPPARPQGFADSEESIAEQRRLGQLLNQKFEEEYPNYVDAAWSYEWKGGGTIPSERTPETLALFEEYYDASFTDARMKNDRLGRINSADIEELRFEPLMLEHFINIVNNFKAVSEHVKVVMLPKNSKWIKTTPEAEKRLAQAVSLIQSKTGINIDDHQDLQIITPEMFRDTTHLARYRGDVPYTHYLVEQYTNYLRK